MSDSPPDYVIEYARQAALQSPCAKSKRGVALFSPGRAEEIAIARSGFNGPPPGFKCIGDDRKDGWKCREHCAKLCMHAEQRVILKALGEHQRWGAMPLFDLELVHVKVIDGVAVPGGGPSCWQCSRLVVEVGLRGVWLYEDNREGVSRGGDALVEHWPSDLPHPIPSWRFYDATTFHLTTLDNLGLPYAYTKPPGEGA